MTESDPPRIAVVVPCFNDAATLRETVESVGRESETELVVVDDGSTDPASLALLDELAGEGIDVIHQANLGPSAAVMAGLAATSAPYVMRLDADDLLEPDALLALARALDRAPDAAVAWGDTQTFGLTTFRIPAPPRLDAWLLTYTNCVPGAGCLMRRSALVDAGGWQLRDGWEDWDLLLALVERGWKGVGIPQVAFRYRRDAGGRHAESLADAARHYEELRLRHAPFFARRAALRRESDVPRALKLVVPLTEAVPGLPRLVRIQLCELATRLFWGGGVRPAVTMLRQAIRWRLAARLERS
jgi:glycosyltransferase involved in cell wall biosynthesis